jgi:hypothetical protein
VCAGFEELAPGRGGLGEVDGVVFELDGHDLAGEGVVFDDEDGEFFHGSAILAKLHVNFK